MIRSYLSRMKCKRTSMYFQTMNFSCSHPFKTCLHNNIVRRFSRSKNVKMYLRMKILFLFSFYMIYYLICELTWSVGLLFVTGIPLSW